jgi:hypothetical protein
MIDAGPRSRRRAAAESFAKRGLSIEGHDVVHTSHPAYGYRIRAGHATAFGEFGDDGRECRLRV